MPVKYRLQKLSNSINKLKILGYACNQINHFYRKTSPNPEGESQMSNTNSYNIGNWLSFKRNFP